MITEQQQKFLDCEDFLSLYSGDEENLIVVYKILKYIGDERFQGLIMCASKESLLVMVDVTKNVCAKENIKYRMHTCDYSFTFSSGARLRFHFFTKDCDPFTSFDGHYSLAALVKIQDFTLKHVLRVASRIRAKLDPYQVIATYDFGEPLDNAYSLAKITESQYSVFNDCLL